MQTNVINWKEWDFDEISTKIRSENTISASFFSTHCSTLDDNASSRERYIGGMITNALFPYSAMRQLMPIGQVYLNTDRRKMKRTDTVFCYSSKI